MQKQNLTPFLIKRYKQKPSSNKLSFKMVIGNITNQISVSFLQKKYQVVLLLDW
jgi:hypothetical protein